MTALRRVVGQDYRVVNKNRVTKLMAFSQKHISDNSAQKPLQNADILLRAGCMNWERKKIFAHSKS